MKSIIPLIAAILISKPHTTVKVKVPPSEARIIWNTLC
jgi:hypothetical protein